MIELQASLKPIRSETKQKKITPPCPQAITILSRIYISSVEEGFDESQIGLFFSQFGLVKLVSMSRINETGCHLGYGYVDFALPEAASLAHELITGLDVDGL